MDPLTKNEKKHLVITVILGPGASRVDEITAFSNSGSPEKLTAGT